jgi:hypothetical protein
MCRFNAIIGSRLLATEYDWQWRLDDDSLLTSEVGYDVFRLMAENGKRYGFPSMVEEFSFCIKGLWERARSYLASLPHRMPHAWLSKLPENLIFYNNFEISHRSVWLDPRMIAWLDYIDRHGGIYYHRWGDAPIHTLGVAMFVPLHQVHRFSDIAYSHLPFVQQAPIGLPSPSVASSWDKNGWPSCPALPSSADAPYGVSHNFNFWAWACASNTTAENGTTARSNLPGPTATGKRSHGPIRGVIFSVVRRETVPHLMQMLRSLERNVFRADPAQEFSGYPVVIFEFDWTNKEKQAVHDFVDSLRVGSSAAKDDAIDLKIRHIDLEMPAALRARGDVPEQTTCTPAYSAIPLRSMNRFRAMRVHQLLSE